MSCNKKKVDKIKAMLIVANAQKRTQTDFTRREIRHYFCYECKAWHTTKQKMKEKQEPTIPFCIQCKSRFVYDIGYNVWECHDCLNHWKKEEFDALPEETIQEQKEFQEWLSLRDKSTDEYDEKLCYCGHTHKCSCTEPDFVLFKDSVKRGTIKLGDEKNGWTQI